MDNDAIKNLEEALRYSPENTPLRLHLAELFLKDRQFEKAIGHFKQILDKEPNNEKAGLGLAKSYLEKKEYSSCIIFLEEFTRKNSRSADALIILGKAYLREGSVEDAQNTYKKALMLNPGISDEELDRELKVSVGFDYGDEDPEFDDYEENFDDKIIEKPDINFNDVGGLENIKKEIDLKIIKPLQHADIYKAYGKKTGGGILLYGPPGCGKTHLARATAGQIDAKFINIGINDVLDMWIGNSEKNLHYVFETARQHKPCVLFFDEIDALGANRMDMRQSTGRHIINQFLSELDGVENDNDGILILGATNAPWHLDPAFRRPGRFDRIIFVAPPDEPAREEILKIKLKGKPISQVDYRKIAAKTEKYSGADIQAVIDIAIEEKLEDSFKTGVPEPLGTKDLLASAKKHKPSTLEWFNTAKNYALYANESGLYDDILEYLKMKK